MPTLTVTTSTTILPRIHSSQVVSSLLQKISLIKVTNDFCIARSNGKFSVLILLIRLLDRNDHSLFPETSFSLASGIPLSWLSSFTGHSFQSLFLILPFSTSCCMQLSLPHLWQKTGGLFSTKDKTEDLWTQVQLAQLKGCVPDHKQ